MNALRISALWPAQVLLRTSASDPSDEVRVAAHVALEALPLSAEAVRPLLDSFLLAAPAVEEYSRKRLRPLSSLAAPTPAHDTAVSGALQGLAHVVAHGTLIN